MNSKTKLLIGLITLCLVDVVIPIPILGIILIFVVLQRPPWFYETVNQIYQTE